MVDVNIIITLIGNYYLCFIFQYWYKAPRTYQFINEPIGDGLYTAKVGQSDIRPLLLKIIREAKYYNGSYPFT
jgi:hypothetical protein